jgi:hypothetical protein
MFIKKSINYVISIYSSEYLQFRCMATIEVIEFPVNGSVPLLN